MGRLSNQIRHFGLPIACALARDAHMLGIANEVSVGRERCEVEREDREAEQSGSAQASDCDPNYSGACLDPYASDYDCAGGSGDGPEYTGPVTVVGEDHYGLDSDEDALPESG